MANTNELSLLTEIRNLLDGGSTNPGGGGSTVSGNVVNLSGFVGTGSRIIAPANANRSWLFIQNTSEDASISVNLGSTADPTNSIEILPKGYWEETRAALIQKAIHAIATENSTSFCCLAVQ